MDTCEKCGTIHESEDMDVFCKQTNVNHQWIPAQAGDVIKKVPSYYASPVVNGEHFVVLDVFNGDNTAVVLGRDGKLTTIVYPEEYEVVGKVQDLINEMHEKM